MNIVKIIYILMPISIYLSFLWAPAAQDLGQTSRIVYYHVPLAWVSVLAFIISGLGSIIYLFDNKKKYSFLEEKSYNSAVIGLIFTILTIIAGAIWGKMSWGSYWNWDIRQKSIIIFLLIYIAYFSLRTALLHNDNRGRITSSYLIFAMLTIPFFIFIIPRLHMIAPDMGGSLHPEKLSFIDNRMRITLLFSIISFTLLYFYIFILMNRLVIIRKKIEDAEDVYEEN